jgi:metallophosphoesterase (TIGR00282 family)
MSEKSELKILFIGDINGRPGRRAVAHFIPLLRKKKGIDFVIANGENLASGKGMTLGKYQEMIDAGVDYFTSGNHIWNNREFIESLKDPKVNVLRPENYGSSFPGRGFAEVEINSRKLLILNLQGRVFMKDDVEDPFSISQNIISQHGKNSAIIVDIHAEATSEKVALGYFLDGKVSAVIGTHTHIQTADEKILENGTAYITDVGMCGPKDSVLGVKKEIIIEKFLTGKALSHKVASGDSIFNAVIISIDTKNKKATKIERVSETLKQIS